MSMVGQVVSIEREQAGVVLSDFCAAGASTLAVDTALDLDPAGGTLALPDGSGTVRYVPMDLDSGVVTLATGLPAPIEDGERLLVDPPEVRTRALVLLDGDVDLEPLPVDVPSGVAGWDNLVEGAALVFEDTGSGRLLATTIVGDTPGIDGRDISHAGEILLADQKLLGEKLAEADAERDAAAGRLTAAEGLLSDAFSEINLLPDSAYVDAAKQQAIDAAAITAQQKADAAKAAAIADAQGKLATARTALEQAISSGDAAAIADAEQKVLTAKAEAIAAAAVTAQQKADAAQAAAIAVAASDATAKAAEAMTKATAALTAAQSAQATADNAIRTYYGPTRPWADGSAQPDDVLGDMWYDDNTGQAYRWNGTTWTVIVDQTIGQALSAAQSAQTTADGKITAFYQPNEPLAGDEGDLWFDTDNGNRVYRRSGSVWVDVADARIAQQATALADVQQDITGLEGTLDGKSNVWVQAAQPTGLGATDKGDIWINNGATPRTTKVWNGTAWIDADSRITKAVTDITKKITTYYTATTTAPTGTFVDGDLWIDINGKIARWAGSWVTVSNPKALADAARTAAISAAATDATTKANAAETAAKAAAAADATSKAATAEANAKAAAATDATTKANQAQADAEAAAATYAETVASGAEQAAIDAAALTAQQKADAAKTAAISAAAADATSKAAAAEAAAKLAAAADATTKANQAETNAKNAASAALAPVQSRLTTAEGLIDKKAVIHYQPAAPTGLGAADAGDIWIDSDANPKTYKSWSGTAWVDVTDQPSLDTLAKVNTKITTFVTAGTTAPGAPSGGFVTGDLWVDSNGKIARWAGSWVTVSNPKALADAALVAAKADATAKADAAREAAKTAAAADATAKSEAAEAAAAATAAADATTKANAAKAAAEAAAAAYADQVAAGEGADALAAAKADATAKANAAELAAKNAAALDATAKANAAEAAAAATAAADATAKANAAQAAAEAAALAATARTMKEWKYEGDDASMFLLSAGAAPVSVAVADASGGKALRSSAITTWGSFPEATMAFSPTTLYRVSARVRRTSGTGSLYLGVEGLAADGTTRVNSVGDNTNSSQHYLIHSVHPTPEWQVYTGFLKGYGTPNSGGYRTLASPLTAHADVRFIRPMMILNHMAAGVTEVDWVRMEAMEPDERIDAAETNAKAFATTTANGLAKTLWSTALPGTTQAPKDSVWYRTDASGKIIAVFTQTAAGSAGSTWVARPIKSEAIDNLDLGKLTVGGSATMQQAVINELVGQLASFIKADIGNLTVTGASNLNTLVAQKIAADTASFLSLSVSQLLAGDINVAMSLIAGGAIIAGDPAARAAQLAQDGLTLYSVNVDGERYASTTLGGPDADSLALLDDAGEVFAGIDSEGAIAGTSLSVNDDISVGLSNLLGTVLDPDAEPGWLDTLPWGIVAKLTATGNRISRAANEEWGYVVLPFTAKPSRIYKITCEAEVLPETDNRQVRAYIRLKTGGTPAKVSDGYAAYSTSGAGYGQTVTIPISTLLTYSAETEASLLLTMKGHNTAHTPYTAYMQVEDVGPYIPNSGAYSTGGAKPAGGTATPDPDPVKRYTTYWNASDSQAYIESGSKRTSPDIVQGQTPYFTAGGHQRSAIVFNSGAYGGSEPGKTIPNALTSGATLVEAWVYLYFDHWHSSAGGTALIGALGSASIPTSGSGISYSKAVSGWKKGQGKWVKIPTSWISSTKRGITIGGGSDGSTLYYGRADGANEARKPRLKLVYIK